MSKRKLCSIPNLPAEKLTSDTKKISGFHIGITYLDISSYGLDDLFKICRGNRSYLKDLNDFIKSSREIDELGAFISKFISRNGSNNKDDRSISKVAELNQQYNIEVDHLIHLHCKAGGKGEFVIHGFQIDNVFEIVWLDPKHEIHRL